MATREELAWAAGFFDGEGCFGCSPGTATKNGVRRRYLRASLSQKYEPLVTQFLGIVGVGTIGFSEARPTSSQAYVWRITGPKAFATASLLWPWLGEQKKADFKRALLRVRESRIAAASALKPAPRECLARDCPRYFTPDVRHDAAEFCSGVCAARHARHAAYVPPPPKKCRGCGCNVDDRTYGCRRCMTRHWQREAKRKAGGQVGQVQKQR